MTKGSAIEFTVTIPTRAIHAADAVQFVQYLISLKNSTQITAEGLPSVPNATFAGDLTTVPPILLQEAASN